MVDMSSCDARVLPVARPAVQVLLQPYLHTDGALALARRCTSTTSQSKGALNGV